jgi:hypothetical protein
VVAVPGNTSISGLSEALKLQDDSEVAPETTGVLSLPPVQRMPP